MRYGIHAPELVIGGVAFVWFSTWFLLFELVRKAFLERRSVAAPQNGDADRTRTPRRDHGPEGIGAAPDARHDRSVSSGTESNVAISAGQPAHDCPERLVVAQHRSDAVAKPFYGVRRHEDRASNHASDRLAGIQEASRSKSDG